MANSPVLFGPNSLANNLQNGVVLSGGQQLSWNGPKNYIANSGLQNGTTTGYALGTTGTLTNGLPTGSPTFGSGASANLGISAVTSGTLGGVYSLQLANLTAATVAGNMVAYGPFSIDIEDQAKVMQLSLYYSTTVNGTVNFSGTSSNSLGWAAYDATNSVWLTTTGNFNFVQSSGVGRVTGTCQTGSSTASMYVIIYFPTATTSASTWLLKDFYFGPQTAPTGPVLTDSQSYTPNYTGFGSPTVTYCDYHREGMYGVVNFQITQGTNTAVAASMSLPSGWTIDTSYEGANESIGSWSTSATPFSGSIFLQTGTSTTLVYFSNGAAAYNTPLNGSAWASSTVMSGSFKVKIAGWSSNANLSSDTDTRVCAAIANGVPAYATALNPIIAPTIVKDTHGAYSGTTGQYTAPVTGYYQVNYFFGCAQWGASTICYVYVAGSQYAYAGQGNSNGFISGGAVVYATAGQTIDVRCSVTSTSGSDNGYITFNRLSGPAVVAGSEVAVARYHSSSSTITSSLSAIIYSTKDSDTHSGYSGSTYTIPITGQYQINASVQCSGTFALNATTVIQIYHNGAAISGNQNYAGGVETDVLVNISDIYSCNAGDTIQIYVSCSATTPAIVSSAIYNVFSIAKTGRGN